MRVVTVASSKGGAGRTTLAAHLAVAAEQAGHGPVILIDTDPQATLTRWWERREAESPALAAVAAVDLPGKLDQIRAQGFRLVVIDTPPAITASISAVIACSDLVVMPVQPSPADLWAVGATLDLAAEHSRPFVFALSKATRGATITTQAYAALGKHGAVAGTLHNRVTFAEAFATGQTSGEIEHGSEGGAEIADLLTAIMKQLGTRTAKHTLAASERALIE